MTSRNVLPANCYPKIANVENYLTDKALTANIHIRIDTEMLGYSLYRGDVFFFHPDITNNGYFLGR